jgi:hypothetical protein
LLGDAIEVLARKPHRTWSITLESLAVARRQADVGAESMPVAFGTLPPM